jgi:multisubunit Na+/H+ antiporter MnhB subunit
MSLFQEYGIFTAGAIILMLILLEWRSGKWPRYRRAAVGIVALLLNSVVLISIFLMVVTATVAASVLFHPSK